MDVLCANNQLEMDCRDNSYKALFPGAVTLMRLMLS